MGSAHGGPVILGGDDLNDHGRRVDGQNQQGWLYIEKALGQLNEDVAHPGPFTYDIAAIGVEEDLDCPFINIPANCPPAGWFENHGGAALASAATNAGLSVQNYPGADGIAAFFSELAAGTANPKIIYIPGNRVLSDGGFNAGDLNAAETTELNLHADAIQEFVQSGGGLMSHGSGRDVYGWLSALLPGLVEIVDDEIFPPECQAEGAFLTPVGQAAFPDLVNSDIDISAGPCHSHFEGDLGDLDIIAMDGTTFVSVAGTGSTVSEVEPSESPLEATFISIGDDVAGSLVKPELIGTGLSVTESQPNESALTATSFALGDDIQGTLIKPVIPGTGNLVPESEPNDSLATATPVNIGDDFSGSLLEPVTDPDTDYFRFSASGGEKLAFTIDFGSDVVFLEFEILASDGTVLNHLCCNLGRLHESIFTLPQTAGTYYIRLHYRAGSGSYVFGLRESDAEDPFYDYDYFSFQASGGEKLAFTIEYANLLFHEFAIIAPDGTTKLQSLCCNLGSPHESSFTLPDVAGTYYLMLRQSAGEGAYTLKVRTTELEHPFLDYDYFAFDAAGGEKLVFRIEYPTALLFHEFAILAPDGITKLESVCCNLGDPYEAIFTLPDITGTYYLLLRQTGTTSDYLVKVRATESAGPFPFIIGGEAVSIVPTPPPSIDLSPDVAFNPVGTSHTLIASVTDGFGAGPEGQQVIFDVIAGPNAGLGDTAVTDASGNATFSYVGAGGIGLDQIQASFFDVHGTEIQSDVVLKSWDDCTIGPISELSPVEGSKFVAGTTLVISGRLLDRGGADTSISTVQINGVPVDTIDASGRFFYVSQIPLGVTTFELRFLMRVARIRPF
jgi:hypothetical protein